MSHEALRRLARMPEPRVMADVADIRALLADRDAMVEINRMLRQRPDLGDRASRIAALIEKVEGKKP